MNSSKCGLLIRKRRAVGREAHDTRERIRSEAHRDRNFTPQRNGFELDGHSIIALFEPSDAILFEVSARQQSRLAALGPFANWNWGCIPS
jgi:hypothetical protein